MFHQTLMWSLSPFIPLLTAAAGDSVISVRRFPWMASFPKAPGKLALVSSASFAEKQSPAGLRKEDGMECQIETLNPKRP